MSILENIRTNISFVITVVLFLTTLSGIVVTIYDRSQDSRRQTYDLQMKYFTEGITELKDDSKEIKKNLDIIKTDIAIIKTKDISESSRIGKLEDEVNKLYAKVHE